MYKYRYSLLEILTSISAVSVSKVVLSSIPVTWFLLLRQLTMYTILATTKGFWFKPIVESIRNLEKHNKYYLMMALFWKNINVFFAYYCIQILPISTFTSLESPLTMIFSLIIAYILLKEGFNINKTLYASMILIGIVIIMGFSTEGLGLKQVVFLTIGSLGLAMYPYYTEKLNKSVDTTIVLMLISLSSVPFAIIMSFIIPDSELTLTNLTVDLTLYIGLLFIVPTLATLACNLLIVKSIEEIGATKTIVLKSVTPVMGVALGVILFGDNFTLFQYIGLLIIIIGIIQYNRVAN